MKTKTYDCVEMVEEAQDEIYEALKNMTIEEELEYWRRQTEELREYKQKMLKGKQEQRQAS